MHAAKHADLGSAVRVSVVYRHPSLNGTDCKAILHALAMRRAQNRQACASKHDYNDGRVMAHVPLLERRRRNESAS